MIPLAIPNLSGNEAKYLQDCVASTFVSSVGPYVQRFEKDVAQAAGCREAVSVSSGTAGLHLALHGVGVGYDDLVIVPSFTFIASANAISHCGAQPWCFDVAESSYTLDPVLVAAQLQEWAEKRGDGWYHRGTGKRLGAIMPVCTLGHPVDLQAFVELGNAYDLPVVVDAAAALGATYHNQSLGAVAGKFLLVYSFNGNKTVTCGGGGAICGNDAKLLGRLRHIGTTARVGTEYVHDEVGFNFRMTNLEAALGCAQLEQLPTFVAAKRRISKRYAEAWQQRNPRLSTLPEAPWAASAFWFATVLLPKDLAVKDVAGQLKERGIQSGTFWRPVHTQEPYRHCPKTAMTVTDSFWEQILALPCSTQLTDAEQDEVIEAVLAVVG